MFSLENKIALITGATGGIGETIAKGLAAHGATVVLTGRSEAKLKELAGQIPGAIAIPTDLGGDGAATDLIAKTIEKTGKIDILVNNAGLTRDTLLIRMTDEQFDEVIKVNLRAAFQLCRAVVTSMIKNRFGRIINVTSIIGHIGGPGQVNYAASKGAISAMTKSIAAEVGSRGITANCVAPGFVQTAMTDGLSEELKKVYLSQIPVGRFGTPEDIAAATVYLASDAASYVNGQTLHINGGMGRF